jgi:hypothetical protein
VHVGRDDEPSKIAIESRGDASIVMVEHRGRVEQNLEDEHAECWRSQLHHHGKLDQHREHNLDRMEARARGDIEVEVGMVHPMHPPKRGDRVKHHMLEVDGNIEQYNGRNDSHPSRNRQVVEQAPAPPFPGQCQTSRCGGEQDSHERGIQRNDGQVARPTHEPRI